MNTISLSLKKSVLSAGILFIGWAANAQAPAATDSIPHRDGMHHHWGNGKDSLDHRGGFRRGPGGPGGEGPGGPEAWHRRPEDGRGGQGPEGHFRGPGGPEGWANRGERGHRPGGEFGRGGRGFEAVRYTPEQRKQVAAIDKEYRQKEDELWKKDNITLKEYKTQLAGLHKEKKGKLDALLTPQQKEEMASRKKRMSEDRQVMEAARLERLKIHLNLTDDQVSKIKAGEKALHDQMMAIHENQDLLPQQKQEQEKALFAKRNDTFKSVLTPDQYTQFEKMEQHHPRGGGGGGRPEEAR